MTHSIWRAYIFIEIYFGSSADGNTKDVLHMEKEYRKKQEDMHIQHGNYKSAVPSLELPKSGFNNLEGKQHYDHASVSGNFSSIVDNVRAKDDMKPIDFRGLPFCGHMNVELLVNHHEATGNKKSCDIEIGENLHGTCPPSCTSSGRALLDETMHNNKRIDECSLSPENNGDERPCLSPSFSQLSHGENLFSWIHPTFTNDNTIAISELNLYLKSISVI